MSIDGLQFTEFDWDFEGKPIWVDQIFPEDVKELAMLVQMPNHVTRMRATNIK